MRRVFASLRALCSMVLSMGIAAGCGRHYGELCQGDETFDCPPLECEGPECLPPVVQCDGTCVDYMDATWDMALVKMTSDSGVLHCPPSAPNAGMTGKEATAGLRLPRRVIACSANPQPTCSSATAVCMPSEPDFLPCVVRDGVHTCVGAYWEETLVVDELGNNVTVCCQEDDSNPP
jgi:hypothetical protein